LIRHSSDIGTRLNQRWGLGDLVARLLRRCQTIWKARASFERKVWGWRLLHQALAVLSRLHKIGTWHTILVGAMCGKDETILLVFWKVQLLEFFEHGFGSNLTPIL
jgi:hypothetical protein